MNHEKQVQLDMLVENYSVVAPFLAKYKQLSYMQLDYATVHEIALFMIEPDFDFDALRKKIDLVLAALPAIKRIFAQPFIHLKENSEILPVEAVRIVDNNTIRHVASHSELWSDVKKNEIKPNKLLTRTYEDNYGIYENLVFCQTVDDVLAFVRNSTRFLKELIYTNQTIEINLLERLNHINYFLALGKLHTGYNRNFDSYYTVSTKCLNKLQFISNTIVPRLKRPVYKNNKVRPAKLKLHKTNVLSMHKEYHQVYKLAKAFAESETAVKTVTVDVDDLQKTYFFFCELLCIFAVGHFNFQCDENKPLAFDKLNVHFNFKSWKLKLKREEHDGVQMIIVCVKKDVCYTAVLIPSVEADDTDELLKKAKNARQADEYVLCSPFEGENLFVDITNIESFRRLQQIMLRAMIYADKQRDDCPFCSNKLTLTETKSAAGSEVYTCSACRTEIGSSFCNETQKTFYYTRIANLRKPTLPARKDWLTARKKEAQMYFRNITELDDNMEIVCPHCGKVHK